MYDLEKAMTELDDLIGKHEADKQAASESLAAVHGKIREMLDAGPHGIQAALTRRTKYSRQQLDRIRRGLSSGNISAETEGNT
ncbi:hypothetical protein ACFROC_19385 [Nocardia tengchongensis]|uniref:hypothetical protein n=1 Tax=Nocardia tengchongensis TaxID=2055889 RepID=UPI00369B40CD